MKLMNILVVVIALLLGSCAGQRAAPIVFSDGRIISEQTLNTIPNNDGVVDGTFEGMPTPQVYSGSPKQLESARGGLFSFEPQMPPTKIALLVPLSGKYQNLGKGVQDAVQLAIFSIREPNLRVRSYDTKGTAFGAANALNNAIADGAAIVLGPIFSKSAKAIAKKAEEAGLPVLSFSNDHKLADVGVFALGFQPQQEVKRVIRYGLMQDIEDYTAILPNNAFGAIIAKSLRETVNSFPGSSVLKSEFYRTNKSGKPIKLANHTKSAVRAALNRRPKKDYDEELEQYNDNPIKYPRGLLIPEGGKRLKEIIELVKKYNKTPENVVLMGGGQWYDVASLSIAELEGAVFAAPPLEKRLAFKEEFERLYGYTAPKLASLGYDAVALVSTVAYLSKDYQDSATTSPYAAGSHISKQAVMNPNGFVGIDGIFRFRADHSIERGLAVYQIKEGQFVTLEDAPRSFEDDGSWAEAVAAKRVAEQQRELESNKASESQ